MMRGAIFLAAGVLLTAGCYRGAPRQRVARASPVPVVQKPSAPTARPCLRYFGIQDMEIQNGILIVRGTGSQLAQIDKHLSSIRAILIEAKSQHAEWEQYEPPNPNGAVVQIHSVADIVPHLAAVERIGLGLRIVDSPQDTLLAVVHEGLGEEIANEVTLRFQGQHNIVVKATPASQDRVNEILMGLREEIGRQGKR